MGRPTVDGTVGVEVDYKMERLVVLRYQFTAQFSRGDISEVKNSLFAIAKCTRLVNGI